MVCLLTKETPYVSPGMPSLGLPSPQACRMRKSSLKKERPLEVIVWAEDTLTFKRVEIHLAGEEKEAVLITIISLSLYPHILGFSFLVPLPFHLIEPLLLSGKRNYSFCLLMMALCLHLTFG